jgi:hypothetical protein
VEHNLKVVVSARFLEETAFLVHGIQALPPKYLLRRRGVLSGDHIRQVEEALPRWQGISRPSSLSA